MEMEIQPYSLLKLLTDLLRPTQGDFKIYSYSLNFNLI